MHALVLILVMVVFLGSPLWTSALVALLPRKPDLPMSPGERRIVRAAVNLGEGELLLVRERQALGGRQLLGLSPAQWTKLSRPNQAARTDDGGIQVADRHVHRGQHMHPTNRGDESS